MPSFTRTNERTKAGRKRRKEQTNNERRCATCCRSIKCCCSRSLKHSPFHQAVAVVVTEVNWQSAAVDDNRLSTAVQCLIALCFPVENLPFPCGLCRRHSLIEEECCCHHHSYNCETWITRRQFPFNIPIGYGNAVESSSRLLLSTAALLLPALTMSSSKSWNLLNHITVQ